MSTFPPRSFDPVRRCANPTCRDPLAPPAPVDRAGGEVAP